MKIKLVHTVTVIAHGVDPHAPALPYTPTKSSPGYDDSIPRFKIIKDWAPMETGGISAECRIKSFRDIFVIVEAAATAQDGPAASALEIKNALNILAAEMAAKYGDTRLSEEFTFYCHSGYSNLDPYIKERAHDIAKLLKDESIELTDEEAAKTFEGSVRYEPDDLTVVDWDGAALFDKPGKFEDDIAILEMANIQLLSLRALDGRLTREMDRFRKQKMSGAWGVWRLSRTMSSIVAARTESLLELDVIDNGLKLYGEWYDARVYALASRKLYLEKWRATVDGKLSTLEKMFEMVTARQGELYNIILEITIVLLIALEIYLALAGWYE